MAPRPSTGRNDLCSCGSGKKFKKCCAGKSQTSWGAVAMGGIVLAIVVGGIIAVVTSFGDDPGAAAVPGRVWSPEHGHYH